MKEKTVKQILKGCCSKELETKIDKFIYERGNMVDYCEGENEESVKNQFYSFVKGK